MSAGKTILVDAAWDGDVAKIRRQLDEGANVNERDEHGGTALHSAATCEVVKLLITHGADVNAQTIEGETPLHLAAKNNNIAKAMVLIRCGAMMEMGAYRTEHTPLGLAYKWDHVEMTKFLESHGAIRWHMFLK